MSKQVNPSHSTSSLSPPPPNTSVSPSISRSTDTKQVTIVDTNTASQSKLNSSISSIAMKRSSSHPAVSSMTGTTNNRPAHPILDLPTYDEDGFGRRVEEDEEDHRSHDDHDAEDSDPEDEDDVALHHRKQDDNNANSADNDNYNNSNNNNNSSNTNGNEHDDIDNSMLDETNDELEIPIDPPAQGRPAHRTSSSISALVYRGMELSRDSSADSHPSRTSVVSNTSSAAAMAAAILTGRPVASNGNSELDLLRAPADVIASPLTVRRPSQVEVMTPNPANGNHSTLNGAVMLAVSMQGFLNAESKMTPTASKMNQQHHTWEIVASPSPASTTGSQIVHGGVSVGNGGTMSDSSDFESSTKQISNTSALLASPAASSTTSATSNSLITATTMQQQFTSALQQEQQQNRDQHHDQLDTKSSPDKHQNSSNKDDNNSHISDSNLNNSRDNESDNSSNNNSNDNISNNNNSNNNSNNHNVQLINHNDHEFSSITDALQSKYEGLGFIPMPYEPMRIEEMTENEYNFVGTRHRSTAVAYDHNFKPNHSASPPPTSVATSNPDTSISMSTSTLASTTSTTLQTSNAADPSTISSAFATIVTTTSPPVEVHTAITSASNSSSTSSANEDMKIVIESESQQSASSPQHESKEVTSTQASQHQPHPPAYPQSDAERIAELERKVHMLESNYNALLDAYDVLREKEFKVWASICSVCKL